MLTYILIAALVVMLASLGGAITIWKQFGALIERHLTLLVSFAAGVFFVIAFELALETFAHDARPLLWISLGALSVFLIFKTIPSFHHHHDEHKHDHTHSPLDARRILISDAIHNVGDGILLVTSFAVSVPFGVAATATIFVHEIVQEISEFFVLRQAGYAPRRALFINFLVSGTILIGALGSYFLIQTFEHIESALLGVAAGALFVVVFYDLIPHSVRASRESARYLHHIIWFLIGAALISSLGAFIGHGHEEEHHDVHSEEIDVQ